MTNLRIITLVFYLFCLATIATFAQSAQQFSLLFSSYYTNDLNKDEFYTGITLGNYGIGGEIRYRFINKKEPITTEIGMAYHQLNFKMYGDIPVSSNSKNRFHLISIPWYFTGNLHPKIAISFHLALEIPFLETSKSFDGNNFLYKNRNSINPIGNLGIGTGLTFRYYFFNIEKNSFFMELFFKRHALFPELARNEHFYLDRIKKPYAIGLSTGIHF